MPKHNQNQTAPGEQEDGSFDLSELPDEIDERFLSDVEEGRPPEPEAGAPPADQAAGDLQAALDEAVAARKRAMADFVNFQRRAAENEVRARREGVSAVIRSLLPVIDHVDMALTQDAVSAEQLLDGVRIARDEMMKALECHSMRVIDPEPGSEFDPNEHQAMMRDQSGEHPPGRVAAVFQVGYALDDLVLRPASVSVSASPEGGAGDGGE